MDQPQIQSEPKPPFLPQKQKSPGGDSGIGRAVAYLYTSIWRKRRFGT
jgi:hypothetical protein